MQNNDDLLAKIEELEKRVKSLEKRALGNKIAIIVHSWDLDRVMSAFILAVGAASFGLETSLFFTFWGLNVLRKTKKYDDKKIAEKLFTLLSPKGPSSLPLSHRHFMGLGTKILKKLLKDKQISSLEELMHVAKELKIKIIACDMTCNIMNIHKEELSENIEYVGVATFFGEALQARIVLFI